MSVGSLVHGFGGHHHEKKRLAVYCNSKRGAKQKGLVLLSNFNGLTEASYRDEKESANKYRLWKMKCYLWVVNYIFFSQVESYSIMIGLFSLVAV